MFFFFGGGGGVVFFFWSFIHVCPATRAVHLLHFASHSQFCFFVLKEGDYIYECVHSSHLNVYNVLFKMIINKDIYIHVCV